MELVQSRIVTDDVEGLAAFYARLVGTPVALNEYYVEVPAGRTSVGFYGSAASPSTGKTRQRGLRVSNPGTRSSSTSWPATWTQSTSASRH